MHDLGFRVELDDAALRAFRPDGTELHAAPALSVAPRLVDVASDVAADACVARWAGERLDLDLAVDAVLGLRRRRQGERLVA